MARIKLAAAKSTATRTELARRAEADSPVKKARERANTAPKKSTAKKFARQRSPKVVSVEKRAAEQQAGNKNFLVVGIGASAGGLEAFRQLLKHLPVDTRMAFVLVQHLDPTHESILTELLSRSTKMPVSEVKDGTAVEPDHVYVIPHNTNMAIAEGVLRLLPREDERGRHRPIDYFLRTLAQDQGHRAIGVILSGTASDGTLGLEAIKAEGGITFAQESISAKYDSMPRSAIAAGHVDFILTPEGIATELARISRHPYVTPADAAKLAEEEEEPTGKNGSRKILTLLRKATGVDFTLYKSKTLSRRIGRRMVLNKLESTEDYGRFLRENAAEVTALYQDILINVTSFFRNPEAFEVLKERILPKLVEQRAPDEPVRAWVAGCSTGEEAYSIAISFAEFTAELSDHSPFQIFATDLSENSIESARAGLYSKDIAEDVSPGRLMRFFTEAEGGYRVNKPIRDMVVFARQNVLTDPPFSRLDLISCRNLLIYLEPVLQRQVLPTLHYALKLTGFLWLGASETVGSSSDLFTPEEKKHHFYSKKLTSVGLRFSSAPGDAVRERAGPGQKTNYLSELARGGPGAEKEADRILLARYSPAGVLINAEMDILQFRGSTGAYLEPPSGKATLHLLKMAREGLMLPLRAAIQKAKKDDQMVRKEGVRITCDGESRQANLEVIPIKDLAANERCFLILFEPGQPATLRPEQPETRKTGAEKRKTKGRQVARLQEELAATREYLQSLVEQHEAANEELQSANEEIQSNNEELQSINEELETAKEELESSNEELETLNDELQNRNLEQTILNDDLHNLVGSINLPILMLGKDLHIRRVTSQAEKVLGVISTDVGRPISYIKLKINIPDLEQLITEVIDTMSITQREVQDSEGRWYSMRVRPYKTLDNKIDGAVIVLVDIDALKRKEAEIRDSRDYCKAIIETAREPLIVLDENLCVRTANRAFYQNLQLTPEETDNRFIYDLGNRRWDIPQLRTLLEDIMLRNSQFHDFEVEYEQEGIGRKTMLLNAHRLEQESSRARLILLAIEDITEHKRVEAERQDLAREHEARRLAEETNRVKDEFLAVASHELRTPLTAIIGWAHLLDGGQLDETTAARALESIQRNGRAQLKLIEDLLDVSHIIAGKLRLEKGVVALIPVIEAAMDTVRPMADAKGVELQLMLDPPAELVLGDASRLQQVLWNLLVNAIEYTPRGGHVEVRLEREGGHVAINVRDTGEGISPEFLPNVFARFSQAESSTTRTHGGLGIGLALVHHLVEAHGGTVRAASQGAGLGATFTVTLPLIALRTEDSKAKAAEDGETLPGRTRSEEILRGLRVLVVDDDRDTREMLSLSLTLGGADVRAGATAREALEILDQWKPDVLVSDIGMPCEDGYDLMRKVRALPAARGGQVPAAALTGYASTEDATRARAAGYQMHMPKPIIQAELMAAVASLAATSRKDATYGTAS